MHTVTATVNMIKDNNKSLLHHKFQSFLKKKILQKNLQKFFAIRKEIYFFTQKNVSLWTKLDKNYSKM